MLKDKFCQKWMLSHYRFNSNADGKEGKVLQSIKPFWSFIAERRTPKQLK